MKLSCEAQEVLDKAFDALRKARVRNVHFEVRPRYCGGSPSLVPQGTCAQEAVDEQEAYERHLTGVYGDKKKAMAGKKGLKWICFARWEKGKKVYRYDLITGETIQEPKRLSWEDKERLRFLRRHVELYGVQAILYSAKNELIDLEVRADMHRETI